MDQKLYEEKMSLLGKFDYVANPIFAKGSKSYTPMENGTLVFYEMNKVYKCPQCGTALTEPKYITHQYLPKTKEWKIAKCRCERLTD